MPDRQVTGRLGPDTEPEPPQPPGPAQPPESRIVHQLRPPPPPDVAHPWRTRAVTLGVAVATVVLVGLVLLAGGYLEQGPTDNAPSITITASSAPSAGCPTVSTATVAVADVAFVGRVVAVTPETVTFSVETWRRGGASSETAQIDAAGGQFAGLSGIPKFSIGGRYVVAGKDGQVLWCGITGAWTTDLDALHRQAFGSASGR